MELALSGVRTEMRKLKDMQKHMTSEHREMVKTELEFIEQRALAICDRDTKEVTNEPTDQYVVNLSTKKWHKPMVGGTGVPPTLWMAYCGWRYGCVAHTTHHDLPGKVERKLICPTCLPDFNAIAALDEAAASDSDSGITD